MENLKIVRFTETIYASFQKSAGVHHCVMESDRDYVITSHQISTLLKDHDAVKHRLFKLSELNPRLVRFNVGARKAGTQRLLLYNGSGGYGDQILTWPIAQILHAMGFEVTVLSDPGNLVCWSNFPFVKATLTLPTQLEVIKMYDYHVFFDYVVNADEHPDQQHPLDTMLHSIGIPPQAVRPEQKVVAPVYTAGEMRSMTGAFADKPMLAIYQLSAALGIRSLAPEESALLLKALATAYPDIHWLAVHDAFIAKEYAIKAAELKLSNVQTLCHPLLRELWALTRRAAAVVAPDSMMIHVAGSMGVPCVGLWGPVDPKLRVCYYKNHVALFKQEACMFAPCHACNGEWPRYCPRREGRKQCDVISAITHDDVIKAVEAITGLRPITPVELVSVAAKLQALSAAVELPIVELPITPLKPVATWSRPIVDSPINLQNAPS